MQPEKEKQAQKRIGSCPLCKISEETLKRLEKAGEKNNRENNNREKNKEKK